jgi:prevent-host-death family protein
MAAGAVTVRELRQNLSVYLRRVEEGETLSVTRRGEPVAVLAPLPGHGSILDRLIAEGRATAARGDLLDLGPPPAPEPGDRPLSEILDEQREDRV